MRFRGLMTAVAASVLASTLCAGVAHAGGCAWTGTVLPHDGFPDANVDLQTGPGVFLGTWLDNGVPHLLRWHDGTVDDSGALPDQLNYIEFRGADGAGEAIVNMDRLRDVDEPEHAATVQDGRITELAPPSGVVSTAAVGVDQGGDIAFVGGGNGLQRFFVWPAGQAGPVEVLVHADQILGMDGILDDRSLVVDWKNDDGHTRVAKYLNGGATVLALPAGSAYSWGLRAAGGWIVGNVSTRPDEFQGAAVWDPNGVPHLLPAGFTAEGINRSGTVEGHFVDSSGQWVPALVGSDGVTRQLPAGSYVSSIADDGSVLGSNNGVPMTWVCR